ncbi:MAG TPA: hypothetical protein VFI33_00060 [Puia sp.]|nr:hypothetical protein [Puia sp.]
MSTITYPSQYVEYPIKPLRETAISRFSAWLSREEKNRIAWVGISITAMAAVFFPLTMSAILFNGAAFKLIIGAMVALALVVITNLAALPVKYTIPAFFLGIGIDIVLIIASFLI